MTIPYVEILRVRRALIIYMIVLAVSTVISVVGILFSHDITADVNINGEHKRITHHVNRDQHRPSRADGATSYQSVEIFSAPREHLDPAHRTVRAKIDSRGSSRGVDIPAIIFLSAGIMAAIFATVCASGVSAENRGHLALAWTKPLSRVRYLGGMFAADALGIVVSVFVGAVFVAVIMIVASVHFFGWPFAWTAASHTQWLEWPIAAVISIVFPIAWFGIITALTASLRERAGFVIGIIWPVALGLTGVDHVGLAAVRVIGRVLNVVNPLAYYGYTSEDHWLGGGLFASATLAHILPLCAIAIAGMTLAGWEWRRLET